MLLQPDKAQREDVFNDVEEEWEHITVADNLLQGSMKSTRFTRKEIFSLYARFKAMSKLSALQTPRQPLVGIDYGTFVMGVSEGNQLHIELLEKLFYDCDQRKQGILDWSGFLQVMIILKPKSLASRIDSCLNLILQKYKKENTNAADCKITFQEVRMMCYLMLTQT